MTSDTLSITTLQISDEGKTEFELSLNLAGDLKTCRGRVELMLTSADREGLRWYFEDYPRFPVEPTPAMASRIESRMVELGETWFQEIFLASARARSIWSAVQPRLDRVGIVVDDSTLPRDSIAWELLRAPGGPPLALVADSFVRYAPGRYADEEPRETLRVLLIVARPHAEKDVGLRSVAGELTQLARGQPSLSIEVLRPASVEDLAERVDQAASHGKPYDVVHFDGHGEWRDLDADAAGLSPKRPRGYVYFVGRGGTPQALNGAQLGRLLVGGRVRALVLNACRSAHAESPVGERGHEENAALSHAVRSFALEAAEAGVPRVVGMRYDITVDAAARLTATIYERLLVGRPLGQAVASARRTIQEAAHALPPTLRIGTCDWFLPVVYEWRPSPLCEPGATSPSRDLPAGPSVPPIGSDRMLAAIERASAQARCVCIVGMVGSGKTTIAEAFVRWWAETTSEGRWSSYSAGQWRKAEDALEPGDHPSLVFIDDFDSLDVVERRRVDVSAATIEILTSRSRSCEGLPPGTTVVDIFPLTMVERYQLAALHLSPARALALAAEVDHWDPLMELSLGNPGVLKALIRAAAFVGPDGVAPNDPTTAPWRVPGTQLWKQNREFLQLARRFASMLGDAPLAPLALFQRIADTRVLAALARTDLFSVVPAIAGMTEEDWDKVLTWISDLGLARDAGRSGYFDLHPFTPSIIAEVAGPPTDAAEQRWTWCMASLAEDLAEFGGQWHGVLAAERRNFEYAQHLALQHRQWRPAAALLKGLRPVLDSPRYREGWLNLLRSLQVVALSDHLKPDEDRRALLRSVEILLGAAR